MAIGPIHFGVIYPLTFHKTQCIWEMEMEMKNTAYHNHKMYEGITSMIHTRTWRPLPEVYSHGLANRTVGFRITYTLKHRHHNMIMTFIIC